MGTYLFVNFDQIGLFQTMKNIKELNKNTQGTFKCYMHELLQMIIIVWNFFEKCYYPLNSCGANSISMSIFHAQFNP